MLESRVCVRFYHKIGFVAALCLMFLAFAPLAEDPCPSMIADWHGMQDVNVTAITGKIVFIGQSQTLTVFDWSDLSRPLVQGSVDFPGVVKGIAVNGQWGFVAAAEAGLRILDVSDLTNPEEVGALPVPGSAEGLAISGNFAYVVAGRAGLRIIDVSNPALPQDVANVDTPGSALSVSLSGRYAFVADAASGLRIIDVGDPVKPLEIGSLGTPGFAYGVTVAEGYAYVADRSGLRVIDVRDPAHPQEVGVWNTPSPAYGVAWCNNHVLVSLGYNSVRIISVIDPAHPREVSAIHSLGYANHVAVSGSHASIAFGNSGLQIVDLSNLARPYVLLFMNPPGVALDVALSGHYVYIPAGKTGLMIVDVTDPVRPKQAGEVRINYEPIDIGDRTAEGVTIKDGVAYVLIQEPHSYHSMIVVDVSDPFKPKFLKFFGLDIGMARRIVIADDYAYIATHYPMVQIIDVSDPSKPVYAGNMYTFDFGHTTGVSVSGGYLYCTIRDFGLLVCDLNNPAQPHPVSFLETPGEAGELAVFHDVVCVADGDSGLRIIDVSDPSSPLEVSSLGLPGTVYDVAVEAGMAYVAGNMGLWAVDISEPTHPELIGNFLGRSYAVAVSGSLGVLSGLGAGIELFGTCAEDPPSAPEGLRATELCSGTIRLNWQDMSDSETGFEVERATGEDQKWEMVGELPAGSMIWTEQGLPVGQSYHYRVRAVGNAGSSAWSNEVAAMVPCFDAVIPVAAHTSGLNGTEWRTDLDLLNLGNMNRVVKLSLLLAGQANQAPAEVRVSVPAGRAVRLADVLSGAFEAGNAAIGLHVDCGEILVNAKFYNTASPCGGTLGTFVPSEPPWRALPGDGKSQAFLLFLDNGSDNLTGFRTNIGMVNGSSFEVEARITLHADDGAVIESRSLVLRPYEHFQFTWVPEMWGAMAPERGWAAVEVVTANGRIYPYAMVVDNLSGDPGYLEPKLFQIPDDSVEPSGGLSENRLGSTNLPTRAVGYGLFIPAATHALGFHQMEYRTDLDLLNPGSRETVVELALLETGAANLHPETAQVVLAPGEAVRVEDLLGGVFHCPNAALGITDPAGETLLRARSYTIESFCGGAAGMVIPGLTGKEALTEGDGDLGVFHHLSYSPDPRNGFHTDIGLVNATDQRTEVIILMYDDDSDCLGWVTYMLAPYEHIQFTRIHGMVGTARDTNGYAVVGILTPGGRVHSYGVVVDNISGDPAYLPMERVSHSF